MWDKKMKGKTKKSLFVELESEYEITYLKDMVEEYKTNKGSKEDKFRTELLFYLNLEIK